MVQYVVLYDAIRVDAEGRNIITEEYYEAFSSEKEAEKVFLDAFGHTPTTIINPRIATVVRPINFGLLDGATPLEEARDIRGKPIGKHAVPSKRST